MRFKEIIFLAAGAIAVYACKKDPPPPPPVVPDCQVLTYIAPWDSELVNATDSFVFAYGADNYAISESGYNRQDEFDQISKYTFNAGKLTKKADFGRNSQSLGYTLYTWQGDGRTISYKVYDKAGFLTDKGLLIFTPGYNSTALVEVRDKLASTQSTDSSEMIYHFDGKGNYTSRVWNDYIQGSMLEVTVVYSYDNKKNPFQKKQGRLIYSVNNPVKESLYRNGRFIFDYDFHNSYDSNGYPTKIDSRNVTYKCN